MTKNIIFAGGPMHLRTMPNTHTETLLICYQTKNQFWRYRFTQKLGQWEIWTDDEYTIEDDIMEAVGEIA